VDYPTYLRQVTVACRAGASGIAVGRAVWQEAVGMAGEQRLDFLRTTGRERLGRLAALCTALARPYSEYYSTDVPADWYQSY
jgi:tagatose 1,6-diphosphate aldolase